MKKLDSITKFSVFASLIYLIQSCGSIGGLASGTMQFYMKEGLGFNQTTMAYYFALIGVAWLIKPLLGMISDFFPIYGYRRKSYIYITNICSIGIWWFMAYSALIGNLTSFLPIVIPMIFLGFMFAITDIAADGLTIEISQANKIEGDLQSVQWASIYIGVALTTVFSIWLANWVIPDNKSGNFIITELINNKLAVVFLITSIFPIINLVSCYLLVQETRMKFSKKQIIHTLKELITAIKNKDIWILMLCIFMLHFSPGFGIPLFFYERDFCGADFGQMPKMWFAWIGVWSYVMGAIGILIYKKYWRIINIRKWLYISVVIAFISTLSYLWIQNIWHIMILSTLFGSFGGFIHVAFLTIAAQRTPKYAEAIIFATYCSVFNLANTASNSIGGWLFGKINTDGEWFNITWKYTEWLTNYGVSENMIGLRLLLIISALFTLLTIIFVPLITKK